MRLFFLLFFFFLITTGSAQSDLTVAQTQAVVAQQKIAFEENKGQIWDQEGQAASYVQYHYQQNGFDIFMLPNGLAYQFTKIHYPKGYKKSSKTPFSPKEQAIQEALKKQIRTETYRMDLKLVNANPNATIITAGKSKDYTQYYNRNALNVHSFEKLTYQAVYPGIDWVIYTTEEGLKYDFVVQPGADPNQIQLQFNHQEGVKINADGSFTLSNRMGHVTEQAPISFQGEQEIPTAFQLKENVLSFQLSNYDNRQPLIIDPNLIWDIHYGVSSFDDSYSCSTDNSGNVYLAGATNSTNNISSGGHQNTFGGNRDAFLVKFNDNGTRQWATYYGGNATDEGFGCAPDINGHVYLTGVTNSTNNISFNGHQNSLGLGGGLDDAFLVKFDANGVRLWATYYGGNYTSGNNSGYDRAYACTTDNAGNVFMTGNSSSNNGIAFNGHQNSYSGFFYGDVFLVKFNSSGVRQWGTYSGSGSGRSCVVDNNGTVLIAGTRRAISSSSVDYAFITKFNTNGTYQWNESYGERYGSRSGDTRGYSCALDAAGNAYLAGSTEGTPFLFNNGTHQIRHGGDSDGFLVKYNITGNLQWETYYGGSDEDEAEACTVDLQGNVYLAGWTQSSSGIANNGHFNSKNGTQNAFVAKFNTNGVRDWGTYYGAGYEWGHSCVLDYQLNIILAGRTHATLSGSNFITKLQSSNCPPSTSTLNINTCTSYSWNGQLYAQSGTYTQTLMNAAGCDSIAVLNLTVATPTGTDVQTTCGSFTWMDGNTYTTSNNSATFTLTGGAANGCDSVVTLNLTVINNSTTGTDVQIACNSFFWIDGNTYTASNNSATFILTNAAGCDSIVTLDLTINNSSTRTDTQTACNSFTWMDGNTYTASNNTATFTLTNAAGCDSVVTLDLTINNSCLLST
ncbi:MAG: hypothetical protein ACRBFS_24095, partial [Aureispira sp.]